jgi:hypothetical protein
LHIIHHAQLLEKITGVSVMKKQLSIHLILICLIPLLSCGGKNYFEAIGPPEKKFYQGKYKDAARMLLPEVNKKSKDQLLFMMECGYMLHAGNDYETSNKVLLEAAKIAQVVPTSVTKQVQALLTNEGATNYKGEDFEKVLIHMYLGINFLQLEDHDAARVEFKKVNNELQKIKTEKGNPRYKQNIMAKYLTAVAYEIIAQQENDLDDLEYAYKEYEQIHALAPNLKLVYPDLQRLSKRLDYMDDYGKWTRKFGKKDRIPRNAGEVVLVFQSGRNAIKKSRGKLMDDPAMKGAIYISLNSASLAAGVTIGAVAATMANAENPIPVFKRRSDKTAAIRMTIDNRAYRTIAMEDIATTAIHNMNDDYDRLKGKVAASVVTKAIASVAAGVAAREIAKQMGGGGISSLIGVVAGAGTGAALFSQMKPDLRCWHTLPAKLHVARAFVRPGKHRVTLDYINQSGRVYDRKTRMITVEKNKKIFLNERTLL